MSLIVNTSSITMPATRRLTEKNSDKPAHTTDPDHTTSQMTAPQTLITYIREEVGIGAT